MKSILLTNKANNISEHVTTCVMLTKPILTSMAVIVCTCQHETKMLRRSKWRRTGDDPLKGQTTVDKKQ